MKKIVSPPEIFLDKYLLIAFTKGLVKVEGEEVVLTTDGKKELDDISKTCGEILNADGQMLTQATKEINTLTTQPYQEHEVFQTMMMTLAGSEPRLLAFLMREKEVDFKNFKEEIVPKPNKPAKLSIVKKPKYDA